MSFCSACGTEINPNAVICVSCGVQVRTFSRAKSKTVAVVLAILFGYFAWLYTYKLDAAKFWISLASCLILWYISPIPVIVAWLLAIIDVAGKDNSVYENY